MVLPGEGDYMATTTRSKKTLHNFSLPNLKWGSHRNLRCMKVDSDNGGSDQRLRRRSSPSGPTPFGGNRNRRLETEQPWRSSENEEGIEEFRVKIMSDLKTVADKMTESMFRKQGLIEEELESPEEKKKKREVSPPEPPGVTAEVRPWNLRKRRAACKAPITETEIVDEKRVNSSIFGFESANSTKFASTLTKKEIEDDYMVMIGHRPPRRPKKRPRTVQRQVDMLHPAFYFTEITQDIYKVTDAVTENVKR